MKINKYQKKSSSIECNVPNDDGSYNVSFSSEKPGRRPYGIECVKHDPGSVNLDNAVTGLPLLWNHDTSKIIGRAENVHIDPTDKRGKCQIRFFSDSESQKVADWVKQGHDCISYRYSIDDYKIDKTANPPIVNITKSTVKEISVVAVPFDGTVGVNKGLDDEETIDIDLEVIKSVESDTIVNHIDETKDDQIKQPVVEIETTVEVIDRDKSVEAMPVTETIFEVNHMTPEERKALNALSAFAIKNDCVKVFDELSASDKSLDEIKSALFDEISSRNTPVSTANQGLTNIEDVKTLQKDFSFARAFAAKTTGDWKDAGFEADVQRQWADKNPSYNGKSLIIPLDAFKAGSANSMAITGAGSNFLFTQYAGFLEMLRPKSVLINNGAQVMPGLSANMKMIVENAAPSTYWIAENSGTDVAVSAFGTTTKSLSPHQLMCQGQFTRQFLIQQPLQFEAKIQQIMLRELALAMDLAGFGNYVTSGVLTAQAGAPSQGILLDPSVTVVALGTNGASISANTAKILNLETTLNLNNALLGFNPIYMTTPGIQGVLKSAVPPGLTYASAPYWHDGTLGGYKAIGTNQLPSILNKGTTNGTCNSVIMGDPANLTFGLFGDLMVDLDDKTLLGQGAYRLIANQMLDVVCTRPSGFAVINDAIAS